MSGTVEKLTTKDGEILFWLTSKEKIAEKDVISAHVVCIRPSFREANLTLVNTVSDGKNVVVQGKLSTRSTEMPSGKKLYRTEIMLDNKFDHAIEVF